MKTFNLNDAAVYLMLSKNSLIKKVKDGLIPASKSGIKWVFREEALQEFLLKSEKAPSFKLRFFEDVKCPLSTETVSGGHILPHIEAKEFDDLLKPQKERRRNKYTTNGLLNHGTHKY